MKLPLSVTQQVPYNIATRGKSVAMKACAGSGKSHTMEAILLDLHGVTVETVPFMVSLYEAEMKRYANVPHVSSLNFHKRGIKLCNGAQVDNNKVEKLAANIAGKEAKGVAELVSKMKCEGVGIYSEALGVEAIAKKYGFAEKLVEQAVQVLTLSDAQTGIIDCDDMLRFPVLFKRAAKFGSNTWIALDEVQDFTPASWVFVRDCLTNNNTKAVIVGDPDRQALMSFTGASPELFDIIAAYFNCETTSLPECRRCSKEVVRNAPHKGDMMAMDTAPMGEVGSKARQEIMDSILEGQGFNNSAILSEANAPLVSFGIHLLTHNVPVQMRAARLESTINRFVPFSIQDIRKVPVGQMAEKARELCNLEDEQRGEAEDVFKAVEALETYCLATGNVKTGWDRVGTRNLPVHPVKMALRKLTGGKTGVTLATGHTAKGLEWTNVYHLKGKMKAPEQDWQIHQQNCLDHVIATRAKLNHYTLTD